MDLAPLGRLVPPRAPLALARLLCSPLPVYFLILHLAACFLTCAPFRVLPQHRRQVKRSQASLRSEEREASAGGLAGHQRAAASSDDGMTTSQAEAMLRDMARRLARSPMGAGPAARALAPRLARDVQAALAA